MVKNYLELFKKDIKEATSFLANMDIDTKLIYYSLQRPLANIILGNYLKKYLKDDPVNNFIDSYLLDDGGMFKKYVYKICDKYYPLKDSIILVPGIGYGKNLFQLASFHPKKIVCFDIYEYPEEWEFLKKEIHKIFKVDAIFYRGDFYDLPQSYRKSFDYIISDAVLEHIKDLPGFIENCKEFLKDKGYFYASFGPIWFGPGGDHIFWGRDNIYDHLILAQDNYREKFGKRFSDIPNDSTEGSFIVKNKLLSYLSAEKYLKIFSDSGFQKLLAYAKISTEAVSLLRKNAEIQGALEKINVPHFDRFCSGLYLWMKLNKE